MTTDNRDERDLELLLYLNDELLPDERAAFEARLASDEQLAAALAEWQQTFGELAVASVEPIEPSAEIVASTLAEVERRARNRAAASEPGRATVVELDKSRHTELRQDSVSEPGRDSLRRARPAALWLALAATLLAAFGLVRQFQSETRFDQEIAALTRQRDDLEQQLANLGNRLNGTENDLEQLSLVLRASTSPEARTVVLAGLEEAPSALGTAVIRTGEAAFFAYSLPALAQGRDYQLWFIGDQGPESAGTFQVDDSGNARVTVTAENLEQASKWAVTIEPAGGGDQPTGPMVLLGSVAA